MFEGVMTHAMAGQMPELQPASSHALYASKYFCVAGESIELTV